MRSLVQPDLTVDDLVLRPWFVTDASALVEAYRDPEIQRWHVRSMTDQEALTWIQSCGERWTAETGAAWAITREQELVGRIGLRTLDLRAGQGEASYLVLPRARGCNIAARSLHTMTEWMFTQLGLHRIELEHSTTNHASCRVAGKANFAAEGTKLRAGLHQDGWHDMHLHARLNSQPEPLPASP